MSFTRIQSPMRVAMLQCCTVGVNCTLPLHQDKSFLLASLSRQFGDAQFQSCDDSFQETAWVPDYVHFLCILTQTRRVWQKQLS